MGSGLLDSTWAWACSTRLRPRPAWLNLGPSLLISTWSQACSTRHRPRPARLNISLKPDRHGPGPTQLDICMGQLDSISPAQLDLAHSWLDSTLAHTDSIQLGPKLSWLNLDRAKSISNPKSKNMNLDLRQIHLNWLKLI